jgi:osmoprotectant transport system substrate-binding protein
MTRRVRLVGVGLIAGLVLTLGVVAGCGDDDEGSADSSTPAAAVDGTAVTIADKGFTESQIVAQLYAQALAAQGYESEVTSLGSSEIAHAAVKKGDIDLYPEYTGTAYGVILGKTDVPDAAAVFEAITTAYAGQGLTTLTPSPYSNDNRVACTQDAVDEFGLTTLSSLGEASDQITYSANPEHLTRADGLPLLKSAYGINFKEVVSVALNLRYKPVQDGKAQCVYAFGTDPQIAAEELVLLEDDKGQFQGLPYENFPVINTVFFDAQPPVFEETVSAVDALLTQEAISELNAAVDLDKEDPADVAETFLADSGILE